LECDQSSFKSVQAAVLKFKAESDQLHLLFCNAGGNRYPPSVSEDGYELLFAGNQMSHALLIKHLLPIMSKTVDAGGDVRIIFTSSEGHLNAGGISFADLKTPQSMWFFGDMRRYFQSKLANVLYAQKLAELYPNITSCSVHPGLVKTEGLEKQALFMKTMVWLTYGENALTPSEGSYNMLWAATTDRKNMINGAYYEPVGWPGKNTAYSSDKKLRDELWDWTQKELEPYIIS
jgi:NAD(P)-dependent dehydrogenase (short-subunit alcohol dehydrogenase family)